MSAQTQQPPLAVYPNTVTRNPPSSHSNDSFGTVFIVLAVIVVVSAVACCLGRICNKRQNRQKPSKQNQQGHGLGHKGRGRESDLEFGFEKGLPTVRSGPIRNGDPRGIKLPPPVINGHHMNGHFKGEGGVDAGDPSIGPM